MSAAIEQRNQDATVYVGGLDEKMNEELLWELMLQCGPVVNVHMPKDKVSGKFVGYGFVEFRGEEDAEYALKVMNMIRLFNKPIKVNKASQDKRQLDVGANIFIGNLDPEVDEKVLYDTFSAFGGILQTPKIMRDTETGISKGYGFVSYESFEFSDLAIECMNGQYLCNRPIVVQYAFKKETPGERHGSQAERMLAASQPQRFKPHTIFSAGDGDTTVHMGSSINNMGMGMQGMQAQYDASQQYMQMQMPGFNPMMPMMGGMMGDYNLPPQIQMPMMQMPSAPMSLPGYMMPGMGNMGMPMPPQVGMSGMPMPPQAMMPPPPPPPSSMYDPMAMMAVPPPASHLPPPPPPPPM